MRINISTYIKNIEDNKLFDIENTILYYYIISIY